MKRVFGTALAAAVLFAAWAAAQITQFSFDPHGDPDSGVLRVLTNPDSRGECQQCHPTHGDDWSTLNPPILFTENTNEVAFWDLGAAECHGTRPLNYPLGEQDRMPETEEDAGYFEANSGGVRRVGVDLRGRWPGKLVYSDWSVAPSGHFYSPHAADPDMPLSDPGGEGRCQNCHDPHGSDGQRDILIARYGGTGGAESIGPPAEYELCFSCHGNNGAGGMEPENRFIEDYYDRALNAKNAGHQIRRNPVVALSWPTYIQVGDMLPCYDCHNPHGSRGYNGVEPNAFLISDQRPGWSGLTETLDDPEQNRRFCFGCHIPSDGVPGTQTVQEIVMNTLPDRDGHASTSQQSCYDCHGRDYTSPTGHNVHNPGEEAGGLIGPFEGR